MAHFILKKWTHMLIALMDIEVEHTKNQLKAHLLFGLDETTAVAEDIGRELIITGHCMISNQIKNTADAVMTEKIKQVAHKYLWNMGILSSILL